MIVSQVRASLSGLPDEASCIDGMLRFTEADGFAMIVSSKRCSNGFWFPRRKN